MRRVLVTGMSGTGKSSALEVLRERGYRTVDTDRGDWIEVVDGERLWCPDRIVRLLAEDGAGALYVSGCVANQGAFYDSFDAVVLLAAPADVLLERVETRATNDYGKRAGERARILDDLEHVEPLLRASCTHELDATRPLGEVVAELELIGAARTSAST